MILTQFVFATTSFVLGRHTMAVLKAVLQMPGFVPFDQQVSVVCCANSSTMQLPVCHGFEPWLFCFVLFATGSGPNPVFRVGGSVIKLFSHLCCDSRTVVVPGVPDSQQLRTRGRDADPFALRDREALVLHSLHEHGSDVLCQRIPRLLVSFFV